jgi:hypothetical protein
MKFFFDKMIDGAFVFIGVFLAFSFDQRKENKASINSLHFNMEQIIRDLPDKKPTGYDGLHLEQKNIPHRNTCVLSLDRDFNAPVGDFYLRAINQNDLARFLDDRSIIPDIIYYYNVLVPNVKSAYELFQSEFEKLAIATWVKDNNDCLTDQEMSKLKSKLKPLHVNFKLNKTISETVGYGLRVKLLEMGFDEIPKRAPESFTIEF